MGLNSFMKPLMKSGVVLSIAAVSFLLWNKFSVKLCSSPAYWEKVAANTQTTCVYSALGSVFKLRETDSFNAVIIGDSKFLARASSALPSGFSPIKIDTCQHDLRDVVGVLNWSTKNLIGIDVPIIIQGGPQLWTTPGFYGPRLDMQPWLKSQAGGFPNKPLLERCFTGLEAALKQHKADSVSHARQDIANHAFKPNVSYIRVAKRGMKTKADQIIWVDDRADVGDNLKFIAEYEAWLKTFPKEMGNYSLSLDAIKSLKVKVPAL